MALRHDFLMSAIQIWKAVKSVLVIPLIFIILLLLLWEKRQCCGKKQVIRAWKTNSSKIAGVSSPYWNWCHVRVSGKWFWKHLLMQMLHQWNSLQRAGVCPLLTSSEQVPLPLNTQSRSQRTALAILEGKTVLHFENTPYNQQQINTAPVPQCCQSNTPSRALFLPLHHPQSCSWIAPLSLVPWHGTKQEAHR